MIGLFIKSTSRDLMCFRELVGDIDRYWRAGNNVVVGVPRGQVPNFRSVTPTEWSLYADEEILGETGYHGKYVDSWHSQQALKLCAHAVMADKSYLCLDSNTRILRDIEVGQFLVAGQVIFELEHGTAEDRDYEMTSLQHLGIPNAKYVGFRNFNQVLLTTNVQELMQHLSQVHGVAASDLLMASCLPGSSTFPPVWTEFHLYGAFCWHLRGGGGHAFCMKNRYMIYNPLRHSEPGFIQELNRHQPLWIKVYARRPLYCMTRYGFDRISSLIRDAANENRMRSSSGVTTSRRVRGQTVTEDRGWPTGRPPAMTELLTRLEHFEPTHRGALDQFADMTFVINLKASEDRLSFQVEQAQRAGFSFYRYPAICGKDLSESEVPSELITSETIRRLLQSNPAALGHGLTYIELLSAIGRLSQDSTRVLILEDDAEILPGAENVLSRCAGELPEDLDIVTIGFQIWNQAGVLFAWDRGSDPQPESVSPNLIVPRGGFKTTAWMFSPRGARKILQAILPWHDDLDYENYRDFLRKHGVSDDYPTPGSLDLFMQFQFKDLNVFQVHDNGEAVIIATPHPGFQYGPVKP